MPLVTTMSLEDERSLGELLRFEQFSRDRLLPWRTRLAPLAEAGDPLAQMWLARLHDLGPFLGKGAPDENRIALLWYGRAADQHLIAAEMVLFQAYSYPLLGLSIDGKKALGFLERAYADAAGPAKAEVALELAHVYQAPAAGVPSLVTPDAVRSLQYLDQVLQLDADNQTAIDWRTDIYADHGDYAHAAQLVVRSRNSAMLEKVAGLCLQKLHDTRCAIRLLQRAVPFPRDDATPPQALMDLYTLVCRKQLARSMLGAIDTPAAWKFFLQWQHNCVIEPGG